MGGYLATITSPEENAFIQNSVKPGGSFAWFGGSDAGHEGIWTWANGPEGGGAFSVGNVAQQSSPSTSFTGYAAWWGSEPNNLGGNENYAYIDANGAWTDDDALPAGANGYVVEFTGWQGTYGYATLNRATGQLTYHLDDKDPDTQALRAGDTAPR